MQVLPQEYLMPMITRAPVSATIGTSLRYFLWEWLINIAKTIDLPWIIIGDFNQVFSLSDKKGNIGSSFGMAGFIKCINSTNLINVNQQGPTFTWTNNRGGEDNVMERLDMAFCNNLWLRVFPLTSVNTLVLAASDHSPIMVFQSLGNDNPNALLEELKNLPMPMLEESELHNLMEPISFEEVKLAIFSFPKDSSPGSDGFHADFYQRNRSLIEDDLL
ncbi:hypothetical protein K1719_001191 [Acacia pycnantha]|nr:hypothetical protein K1719_001191 [Acacia pycnantha]